VPLKLETLTGEQLADALKLHPCPFRETITQILIAVQREPTLKDRIVLEIAHVMHATSLADKSALNLATVHLEEHMLVPHNSLVPHKELQGVMGAILPTEHDDDEDSEGYFSRPPESRGTIDSSPWKIVLSF